MQLVNVSLDARSYTIRIGSHLCARLGSECAKLGLGRRCAVVSDANVVPLYGEAALQSLRKAGFEPSLVEVPAGEQTKSLKHVAFCYDQLAAHRLDRRSFVVALGGGVVGDLAGFVAASYLRGIAFVQVPTTLLAQVDSSVGGKVGVNLKSGKNLVGAFHQPRLVLCDLDMLRTLPGRELRAGVAEVIKYGVIADSSLFARLEKVLDRLLTLDDAVVGKTIARCCQIKAEVVAEDETESGRRATLNFGHTIGHALEAISHYGKYLHGEAISIGQVLAARLSEELMGLPRAESSRIEALLGRAGLPTNVSLSAPQQERLLAAMQLDKKVSGGEVRFVLARRIGEVEHGCPVSLDRVQRLLAGRAESRCPREQIGLGPRPT